MAVALRTAFIGIPSWLGWEALRAVKRHSKLVGIAESKPSYWRPTDGNVERHRSPFTDFAGRNGIPFLLLGHGESLAQWLGRHQPDVLCVAGMTRLLTPEEFGIPPLGAINLHPSLLPNFRGPHPFYWQYYYCDLNGGVTVHQVSAGADEGDILVQRPFRIALGDHLTTTMSHAAHLGAAALAQTLRQLSAGQTQPTPQRAVSSARYAPLVPQNAEPSCWLDWPLDHVWHFLQGTHCDRPFLSVPFGFARDWRIGKRDPHAPPGPGVVRTDDERGTSLWHPSGCIQLLPPLPWTLRRKVRKRLHIAFNRWRWIGR